MTDLRQMRSTAVDLFYRPKRWMYHGGRPGRLARATHRASAFQFSAARLSPERAVTLEVVGRHSGRTITFPVVVAGYRGERYLVSPVLRRYLEVAPGARPHVPVDRRAPQEQFERIAADFPVCHITAVQEGRH